jgi:hypothetical protein
MSFRWSLRVGGPDVATLGHVFERSRRIKLDESRELVVSYAGERFGWSAYIPGDTKRSTLAKTPAAAIATHLDYRAENTPSWVEEFSER